jgi:uncharacterized protein YggE
MTRSLVAAFALASAAIPSATAAQTAVVQPLAGTRLDISATGEVARVPDIAIISAGVVTRADTASAAIAENAARMERVRAALRRAGIAARDIQTSSVNLNPDYVYAERQPPRLSGYQATNTVNVRFRDIRNSGRILDALVAEGANQISGPTLTIDKPETALDEARTQALAAGRARAELYARSLGLRVVRLLSVTEGSGFQVPPPMPYARGMVAQEASVAKTDIVPGEQQLQVTVQMSFELR